MNSNLRLKILVIAYECSPVGSHTPGAAWQILTRLSQHHELWIVTEETQYREEIEAHLAECAELAERMHFFFLPRSNCKVQKMQNRPVIPVKAVLAYRNWLRRALPLVQGLHEKVKFDLIHHLRGNAYREPGKWYTLPIPYVWGPTGGAVGVPWRMLPVLPLGQAALWALRNVINSLHFHFQPSLKRAARAASTVFVQTQYEQRKFREILGAEAVVGHEQNADCSKAHVHSYDGNGKLRIGWIGRCLHWKGLPILLRALQANGAASKVELHVFGDGPQLTKWKQLASRLGIANSCVWHGWVAPAQVIEGLDSCHLFACTRLDAIDCTTTMQAFGGGLPVLAFRHGWSSDILDETCGFPIRPRGVRHAVRDFAGALQQVQRKPELIEQLSENAIAKARHFTWDHLVGDILAAYSRAVAKGSDHPQEPESLGMTTCANACTSSQKLPSLQECSDNQSSYIVEMASRRDPLRVLEAGCGRRWRLDLKDVQYILTGVDLNQHALEFRRDVSRDLDIAILDDITTVDFQRNEFDVICSFFVLEHIDGAEALLSKFISWLKPGGLLVLQIQNRDSVWGFLTRLSPFWLHIVYKRYIKGNADAGKPGHDPFPVFYNNVVSRRGIRAFSRSMDLHIRAEYSVAPRRWKIPIYILHLISGGALSYHHQSLAYIIEKQGTTES